MQRLRFFSGLLLVLLSCALPLDERATAQDVPPREFLDAARRLIATPQFKAARASLDSDYPRLIEETIKLTEIPAPPFNSLRSISPPFGARKIPLASAGLYVGTRYCNRLHKSNLDPGWIAVLRSCVRTIQGPGIFLAQFAGAEPPFSTLDGLAGWAAGLGYRGVQIPSLNEALIDLRRAAESQAYCDELRGVLAAHGLTLTELSTHLQGQLIAVHPAYDALYDANCPPAVRGDSRARTEWATQQLLLAAKASRNLGLDRHVTFSGSLAWPYLYPWPPRPPGLIDAAFAELAKRWRPILDAFDREGIDVCFELHPGEDLFDGATFERFLALVDEHPRCNILYDPSHFRIQQLDYLAFLDIYHARIKAFHVKDAEFNPTGRQGVYGAYEDWIDRAGRFRSLGDGDIDFGGIFSRLAAYDYGGWAVLEWECCLKDSQIG
ncbi:MAG: endonuclease, partial [Tardiphaga sp.]|nr:endonuclease [Tardiphaga sp.]